MHHQKEETVQASLRILWNLVLKQRKSDQKVDQQKRNSVLRSQRSQCEFIWKRGQFSVWSTSALMGPQSSFCSHCSYSGALWFLLLWIMGSSLGTKNTMAKGEVNPGALCVHSAKIKRTLQQTELRPHFRGVSVPLHWSHMHKKSALSSFWGLKVWKHPMICVCGSIPVHQRPSVSPCTWQSEWPFTHLYSCCTFALWSLNRVSKMFSTISPHHTVSRVSVHKNIMSCFPATVDWTEIKLCSCCFCWCGNKTLQYFLSFNNHTGDVSAHFRLWFNNKFMFRWKHWVVFRIFIGYKGKFGDIMPNSPIFIGCNEVGAENDLHRFTEPVLTFTLTLTFLFQYLEGAEVTKKAVMINIFKRQIFFLGFWKQSLRWTQTPLNT